MATETALTNSSNGGAYLYGAYALIKGQLCDESGNLIVDADEDASEINNIYGYGIVAED